MGRKKSLIPGFSLNRALGVTSAKQKIARATGIPTTKEGRKRKMQRSLWTAVAVGTAAAKSKGMRKTAVPSTGDCAARNSRLQGKRIRRAIIVAAIVVCVLFSLVMAVLPDLLYLLGF